MSDRYVVKLEDKRVKVFQLIPGKGLGSGWCRVSWSGMPRELRKALAVGGAKLHACHGYSTDEYPIFPKKLAASVRIAGYEFEEADRC